MFNVPDHMSAYVRFYPGVISPGDCLDLIGRFEQSPVRHITRRSPGYSFTEINISDTWPDVQGVLGAAFESVLRRYGEDVGVDRYWPSRRGMEKIRMKRYLPGGPDAFPLHLDVGDYASARRFLVMFAYLNDVEEGGETAFPQWKIAHKPKAGAVLAFPPMWPFLHEGRPPVSGPKYIAGCYGHYL